MANILLFFADIRLFIAQMNLVELTGEALTLHVNQRRHQKQKTATKTWFGREEIRFTLLVHIISLLSIFKRP